MLAGFGGFALERDGAGGRVNSLQDGALDVDVVYDESGRHQEAVYRVGSAEVFRLGYSYDARGLLASVTGTAPEGVTERRYRYDGNGQLIEAETRLPDGTVRKEEYGYDENRNRTSRILNGAAQAASLYGAQDRLLSAGGDSYEFDAAGYLTARGEDRFTYGSHGELMQATADGQNIRYAYDALGRRVSREDETGKTRYLYGNPLFPLLPTAVVEPGGAVAIYLYDENGLLIAIDKGEERFYVVTDGVGTPQRVIDGSGAAVKKLSYDSYGVKLDDSNPDFALAIGFAGGLEDEGTKLVRFGLRDYDPQSGRWTARDPILYDSGQANLYAYVNNNPVQLRDPCGMFCVGGSAYAGVGGGAQICLSSEGMSVCGELGVGAGGGLELNLNPAQDLADTGLSLEASAGVSIGPVGIKAGYQITRKNDCISHGEIGGADLGPLTIDFTNPANTGLRAPNLADYLDPSVGAQAKLAGKACGKWLW